MSSGRSANFSRPHEMAAELDDLKYLVFQGMAGKAPRVNTDNYHWEVWDNETEAWVDTGVEANGADGADGFSPTVTITGITGGHRVTITDEEHPQGQSFDVLDGDQMCNGLKYGADPTGQNDSSAAINACLDAEGYCSLPRGTYKTTSPIIMDGFRDELLVDGRINYTGDDAAIYVKNGFCHIELDSLYSTGKGVVLESTSNVYTSGLAGYGVFNINHIKSTKACIVLDSTNGGIHYNTFSGNSLWANTDQYGNSTNDRTYNCIEIVNTSPYWNSRNVFNGYAVCFALNGVLIDGGTRDLCYGNAFNDFSFERCTNNFNAIHFMNTILSNAAMQEKTANTKCLILADFGKGNKFSFTELLIERIDVDTTGISETARVDIEGSLMAENGTVIGNSFVISAYGSYSIDPGMTPLRVNAIANRRYTTPLNSLHFYGYGDTGTVTLPSYIGGTTYREHEFWYTHIAAATSITLVDSAGNTALSITGGTGSDKVYHCVYVQGIGWKNTVTDIPNELPTVTASDNGKFLRVVGGAWAAAEVPSAESASFGGGS